MTWDGKAKEILMGSTEDTVELAIRHTDGSAVVYSLRPEQARDMAKRLEIEANRIAVRDRTEAE